PRLPLFGGYEDITDAQLKSEMFQTAQEILQGQWASISRPWESRRDIMLNALTRAVAFSFKPALQFDPAGTIQLCQSLTTGRYRERIQADKKNYHIVNAFTLLLARLEVWKAMPKDPRPRNLPPSPMSA